MYILQESEICVKFGLYFQGAICDFELIF